MPTPPTTSSARDLWAEQELVVLLDELHRPVGTAPKATVHGAQTPLHLAFSCYVVDGCGRVLMTRRALEKKTWPGVWTNSFCGHPGPEESFEAAIRRRAAEELGLELSGIVEVLPDFVYRAVDANGVVENEVCPVYVARTVGDVKPLPTEVMEYSWVEPRHMVDGVAALPGVFSPWMGWQLEENRLVRALLSSV